MTPILTSLIFLGLLFSYNSDNDHQKEIIYGKNHYTTLVDGDKREYFTHVPSGYDGSSGFPVVFMLHGASGSGDQTYNGSGWKELAEDENILTVFPTAWSYCLTKRSGEVKRNNTRWNSFPGLFEYCDSEDPRDDVKFLRQVVQELKENYNVDEDRIYMAGFSSGAQMAFRCGVEMNDILAAIVQSGATHQVDNINTTIMRLPVALELGNKDKTWFKGRRSPSLESFDNLLNNRFQRIIKIHAKVFGFETEYELTQPQKFISTAIFDGIPDVERKFSFTLIDGLDHSYPNTVNHPIHGAKYHWEWMKQFTK